MKKHFYIFASAIAMIVLAWHVSSYQIVTLARSKATTENERQAIIQLTGRVLIDSEIKGGTLGYSHIISLKCDTPSGEITIIRLRSSFPGYDDAVGKVIEVRGKIYQVSKSSTALYQHILRTYHDSGVISFWQEPRRPLGDRWT